MDNTLHSDISIIAQMRGELADTAEEQADILGELQLGERQKAARDLADSLRKSSFVLLVIGEFKAGKSTFINSLLRRQVLPSFSWPTTAVINEVKWGEQERAILHYKPQNGATPDSHPIPVDELTEYVVIKDEDNAQEEIDASPYRKVELFWPLKLCQDGVVIVDSPGLNENPTREAHVLDYLPTADAVIFVFSAIKLGPALSEKISLERIQSYGHDDIFMVVNRFDNIPDAERDMFVKKFRKKLADYNKKRGARSVYFISARLALEGGIEENPTKMDASSIQDFLTDLGDFLKHEKGRTKLEHAVNNMGFSLQEIQRVLEENLSMYNTQQGELKQRIKEAEVKLQGLDHQQESIVASFNQFSTDMRNLVELRVRKLYRNIGDESAEWLKEYQLENRVNWKKLVNLKPALEAAVDELSKHLAIRSQQTFDKWQAKELVPYIEKRWDELREDLDDQLRDFFRDLDEIRVKLTGVEVKNAEVGAASPLERLMATATGWVITGPGGAAYGAVFGFRGMMRTLAIQLVAGIGAGFLFGLAFWPVLIVAMVAGFADSALRIGSMEDKIKVRVASAFRDEMYKVSEEKAREVADNFQQELNNLETVIRLGLDTYLNSVRQQYNMILDTQQKGKQEVEAELKRLRQLNNRQQKVADFLADFERRLEDL